MKKTIIIIGAAAVLGLAACAAPAEESAAESSGTPTPSSTAPLWKDKDNDGDGIPNGQDTTINGPTATPTPVAPPPPPPGKDQYGTIGERDWALLVKNPDGSIGQRIIIYAQVTQFDAATGTTTFRANGFPAQQSYYWDGDNIMINGSAGLLAGVVEDDILKIYATADGSLTYSTQIGGSTTVPEFTADYIDIIGHDD